MIYLDYNATTPVLAEVREAMAPYLDEKWGNPSSTYRFGSQLKSKIEGAREQVAALIGCKTPREIIFTSGGTESNNTAIHSAIHANPAKRHLITSQVEHSSVLSYHRYLEKYQGCRVTYLSVNSEGLLSLADLEQAIAADTALVSLMWANNETGVLFPVEQIAQICRIRGVPYHCDAVQAAGKLPISVSTIPIDYLSITGHKIGAPKGVGALYVRKKTPFVPFVHGGHQEREMRGGTENVPFVIGFGTAAAYAQKKLPHFEHTIRPIRDKVEERILTTIPNTELNGHPVQRLANTTNIIFHGVESEALLLLLDQAGICASSGSACLADSTNPSHVVTAMKDPEAAGACIRLSFGSKLSSSDIERVLTSIIEINRMLN